MIMNVCSYNDSKRFFEYDNITGMKLEGLVTKYSKICAQTKLIMIVLSESMSI